MDFDNYIILWTIIDNIINYLNPLIDNIVNIDL